MFGKISFFGYNNNMKIDVAIIGAGPAGLTAGIFTSRAGLKTVCFEKLAIGGQAALSYEIANYPGFESISGFDLTQKMHAQAESCGTTFIYESVKKLKKLIFFSFNLLKNKEKFKFYFYKNKKILKIVFLNF